jgi:hypothetical protein
MNPIPTTNAMKPAPGKGVSSYPTPVIKDTIIVEVVNAWKGNYVPLEYGAKWDDAPHASVQGSFPDHKLISQAPNSEDGQWVKLIWANDRVDQDTYNYAIKYSAGSDAHPIYIRTYLEPRETYTPVPDLSPDPLFPGAFLVDEEVTRTEGEFDSRYVQVTRIYETLPGPIVRSKRINERGDLETIEKQTVPPSTNPDPDGLFVTQTQVVLEDVSKGEKTTATVPSYSQLLIKENKEGLLGETVTTDDIVDPATQPDPLSQTIVASVVQQTSATKAVKRTTTASGPTSLTQKSKDGKLLGDVTITESVVAPNTNPDTPTGVETGILSSEVKQIDSGKAIKRNASLNSTPTLLGSEKKAGLLGETTTTEMVVAAGTTADGLTQSVVASSVEPIDATRSRKVTQTSSGPTTLTGKEKKDGLLGETTVTRSIVPSGSEPDQLSETIVSSSVSPIDSAKSEKTTITLTGPINLGGKKNSSGLLGEQTITESIVPAGSQATPLSLNVVSSEVSPIDSAKSKLTTVSGGPSSLSTTSLVDSQLGLVEATVQKSIVAPNTQPTGTLTKTKDSIEPIDSAKSQREQVTVNVWPKNAGVDYDEQLGLGIYYEETIVPPSEYTNPQYWADLSNIDYKPIDQWKSLRRKVDKEKIAKSMLSQWYKISTDVQVSLPDKLLGVTVYWGSSYGASSQPTIDYSGSTGSYSLSQSSSSKSSASINGDIYFNIQQGFQGALPGFQHIFFIPIGEDGRISEEEILEVLNNFEQFGQQKLPLQPPIINGPILQQVEKKYQRWPYIQARTENLVVISGGKSQSFNTSKSESVSINGFGSGTGYGESFDVDVNARSVNIPQTLHGPITIKQETFGSSIPENLGPTYGVRPEIIQTTKAVINGTLQDASVFPVGNYLYSSNVELYKWGFVKVTAVTVEITGGYV